MKIFLKTLGGGAFLVAPLGVLAGGPPSIFWEPAPAAPVPALSTFALISVSILLAVVAARFLHKSHRHLPLVIFTGVTTLAVTYYPESGAPPALFETGCEGGVTLPRVLQNTCDRPIQVRYAWGVCPVEAQGSCVVGECVPDGGIIAPSGEKATLECVEN